MCEAWQADEVASDSTRLTQAKLHQNSPIGSDKVQAQARCAEVGEHISAVEAYPVSASVRLLARKIQLLRGCISVLQL